jgi:hypothetical protein
VQKTEVAEVGTLPFGLSKSASSHASVSLDRQLIRRETRQLKQQLRAEFSAIAAEVRARAQTALQAVNKLDDSTMPHEQDLVDTILANLGWAGLIAALAPIVPDASATAAQSAAQYADDRSAELLGYSRNIAGDLLDDPSADLSISDSTRSRLDALLEDGLEEGDGASAIAASLEDVFSPARADLIAEYEINRASNLGVLSALQAGLSEQPDLTKHWQVLENCCKRCSDNAAAGPIGVNETFPSGDIAPGAHPFCRCVLLWDTGGG